RDAHLAAGGEDVDRAVIVGAEVGPVCRRRHRELLDLYAECRDVLSRLSQGRRQLLVLRHRLRELTLRLEQSLFERADALRSILQPPPQDHDLLFEALDHLLELVDLRCVFAQPSLVLGSHVSDLLRASDPSPAYRPNRAHPIPCLWGCLARSSHSPPAWISHSPM